MLLFFSLEDKKKSAMIIVRVIAIMYSLISGNIVVWGRASKRSAIVSLEP